MASVIQSGPEVGHWCADKLEMGFFEGRAQAIGLRRDGKIIASVIYENWNGRSIMCHMVVEGKLNRAYIRAIFDYAYRVCAVFKVVSPVASTNTRCRHFIEHLGFTPEAVISDAHPDGDIIVYSMKADDCRFLGERWEIQPRV